MDDQQDVDQTTITGEYPGDATFNYTVTVGHDAGTASGWALSGKITVTNPNDFAVTADVTDTIDHGSPCKVTGGTAAVIPASNSPVLPYSCPVTDGSATENTATVTWAEQGILDAGSDFVVVGVSWVVDIIDECVDVTDPFDGVEIDLATERSASERTSNHRLQLLAHRSHPTVLQRTASRLVLFGPHTDLKAHADARAAGLGPMWARSKLLTEIPSLLPTANEVGSST